MIILENIKFLEEKISKKCIQTGRKRDEITLIAVSKTQSVERINEAIQAGLIHLGENKAQELTEKYPLIKEKVVWHFIGHLQTNKVKYIINSADYIHSVDSLKLAAEIEKRSEQVEKVQKILLEIKTSDEETKHGLEEEKEIVEVLDYCKNSKFIEAVGLMTMAPFVENEKIIRASFNKLRVLKEKLNNKGYNLRELSMGMTGDYEIAIEEGATMLRIGTAVFGERTYN